MGKLLFLLGCIPTRLLLALSIHQNFFQINSFIAPVLLAIAVGFFVFWALGIRKTRFQLGTSSLQQIYWDHFRPVHGLFYASAATALFFGYPSVAAGLIALDALVGLGVFLNHYY